MKPRLLWFPPAFALVTLSLPATAATIYSDLKDIPIPTNLTGVYLEVLGGATNNSDSSPVSGWGINPFYGGIAVANSPDFQPVRTGTGIFDAIVNFLRGDDIDEDSVVASGYGGSSTHLDTTAGDGKFGVGTEGYIGFKLNNDGTTNYGWMRVIFDGLNADAVIKDWAYDNSGDAIVVGRVEQSAVESGAQTVTLSPQGTESFSLGSLLTDTNGNVNSVAKTGAGTTILTGANTYTGTTIISAGTLELGNNLALQNSVLNTSGAGTLAFSSGINTPTFGGLTGASNLTLASNVTALTLRPGTGVTRTYSGILGSATPGMSLTKTGAGTQVLSGANTYTGGTSVNAGTLLVNNTGGSGTGSGSVVVASGSTNATAVRLGGTGTISGATTFAADPDGRYVSELFPNAQVGGVHAPGDPALDGGVGKQTFSSNLTYNAGSIFEWDLNGNTTGNRGVAGGFDAVDVGVAGTLTVDGTPDTGTIFRIVLGADVNLVNPFWSTPNVTHTWDNIFSYTTVVGGFDTSNIEVVGASMTGVGSFSISGTSLTFTAVPEVSNLLAGVLLAAGLLRRRR